MSAKLLFICGIVVAHGAVAAALLHESAPVQRPPVSTCVQTPAPLPYFQQQAEMLAWVAPVPAEDPLRP
jgi:hypothetical protein